jgi:hypothetical protein
LFRKHFFFNKLFTKEQQTWCYKEPSSWTLSIVPCKSHVLLAPLQYALVFFLLYLRNRLIIFISPCQRVWILQWLITSMLVHITFLITLAKISSSMVTFHVFKNKLIIHVGCILIYFKQPYQIDTINPMALLVQPYPSLYAFQFYNMFL